MQAASLRLTLAANALVDSTFPDLIGPTAGYSGSSDGNRVSDRASRHARLISTFSGFRTAGSFENRKAKYVFGKAKPVHGTLRSAEASFLPVSPSEGEFYLLSATSSRKSL